MQEKVSRFTLCENFCEVELTNGVADGAAEVWVNDVLAFMVRQVRTGPPAVTAYSILPSTQNHTKQAVLWHLAGQSSLTAVMGVGMWLLWVAKQLPNLRF